MKQKIKFRGQLSPIMSAIRMGGDVMRISIDIPLTEREKAIGLLALTDQPLTFEVGVDSSSATQEKPTSGPYAMYWNRMVVKGVKTYPDLQEALDCTSDQVWDALHAQFGVTTMSVVSPDQWEKWVEDNGLSQGLIALSRNAEVEAAKTQGEMS